MARPWTSEMSAASSASDSSIGAMVERRIAATAASARASEISRRMTL